MTHENEQSTKKIRGRNFSHVNRLDPYAFETTWETIRKYMLNLDVEVILDDGSVIVTSSERAEREFPSQVTQIHLPQSYTGEAEKKSEQ